MRVLIAAFFFAPSIAIAEEVDLDAALARINEVAEMREHDRNELIQADYRRRREQRWEQAIAIRRKMNAAKVHRYSTARQLRVPAPKPPANFGYSGMGIRTKGYRYGFPIIVGK